MWTKGVRCVCGDDRTIQLDKRPLYICNMVCITHGRVYLLLLRSRPNQAQVKHAYDRKKTRNKLERRHACMHAYKYNTSSKCQKMAVMHSTPSPSIYVLCYSISTTTTTYLRLTRPYTTVRCVLRDEVIRKRACVPQRKEDFWVATAVNEACVYCVRTAVVSVQRGCLLA